MSVLEQGDGRSGGPEVGWAGPDGNEDEVGHAEEGNVFIRPGGRGVDKAIGRFAGGKKLQAVG